MTRDDVQTWWSDAAADAVHKYSCDGIFVDGATAGSPGGALSRVVGKEKAAAMDQAVFAMLKEARRKMGPDKLIVFNPLHGHDGKRGQLGQEYLPVTDGAMVDDFDRLRAQSKEYMANTIKTMRVAAKDGKVIIFKGWPRFLAAWRAGKMKGASHDEVLLAARKDITFPLACFLVGAEPNCFFCYTWGWDRPGRIDGLVPRVRQTAWPAKARRRSKRMDVPARIRTRVRVRRPGEQNRQDRLEIKLT